MVITKWEAKRRIAAAKVALESSSIDPSKEALEQLGAVISDRSLPREIRDEAAALQAALERWIEELKLDEALNRRLEADELERKRKNEIDDGLSMRMELEL